MAATIKPTSDSDIKVEVWLPAQGWNGNFQGVGNGGWAGVISYREFGDALRGGYATASTDTGHVGGRGTFALDHPEKLIDFGWRSEHEMTVKAKAVIKASYGSAPKLSYWNGCSTGGRQGLKEAQKFPDDYNAVIAGAPANRTAISLWIAAAVLKDPAIARRFQVTPFWSPDSRFLGFAVANALKKIDVSAGPAVTFCTIQTPATGIWHEDGLILLGTRGPARSIVSLPREAQHRSSLS